MTPEEVRTDLMALKPFLRAQSVLALGGEPLLNKQLPEILRVITEVRIDKHHVVITNGRLLNRMGEEFWKALEFLQVSVYPGLDPDNLALAARKSKDHRFGFSSTVFDRFYTQLRTTPTDGSNFHGCHWSKVCRTVHRSHLYLCSQSAFFPKAIMGLEDAVDGLPLAGLTEAKLKAFLERTEPLNACRVCRANEMQTVPWSESKRSEWIAESTL